MTQAGDPLCIAVDGGGSRCRVAAPVGQGVVSVEAGAANVSTDFDGAVRQILQALELLAARLGRSVDSLRAAPAFVGLAGVTGPRIANRLRAALPFATLRIADDRIAAVRGALGQRDGMIAHCGTGSFYAHQGGGEITLAGGWGPVLGDEASAQWVGRLALGLTLKAVDGRLAPSALTARLLSDLGDTAGIVRFAGRARPSDLGALAPLVTGFAAAEDAVAVGIMRRAAEDIAEALGRLGWRPGQPVCLTGGIGPHYAPYLPDDLGAHLSAPEADPLAGALSLARDLAREVAREHR